MPLSDFDRNNVEKLLNNPKECDWFTARLLRLICHADTVNRSKLAIIFPEEVKLVCEHLGHRVPEPWPMNSPLPLDEYDGRR